MSAPLATGIGAFCLLLCGIAFAQPHDHAEHVQHADHDAESGHDAHEAHAPPLTDADRAAAFPDVGDIHPGHDMHRERIVSYLLFDRLELQDADHGRALHWDIKASIGGDFRKLWLRTEGERSSGRTGHGDIELLFGRAIAPWWDLVTGVRHEFAPGAARNWAAVGLLGLAPYRFEVEATAWLGEGGRVAAALEADYELTLTRRIILQPLFTLHWYASEDAARQIGAGLASSAVGLRFRYEIRRNVAPYVGVTYESRRGATAGLVRAAGEPARQLRVVAGIRMWF
jgi:copper resistance protein B